MITPMSPVIVSQQTPGTDRQQQTVKSPGSFAGHLVSVCGDMTAMLGNALESTLANAPNPAYYLLKKPHALLCSGLALFTQIAPGSPAPLPATGLSTSSTVPGNPASPWFNTTIVPTDPDSVHLQGSYTKPGSPAFFDWLPEQDNSEGTLTTMESGTPDDPLPDDESGLLDIAGRDLFETGEITKSPWASLPTPETSQALTTPRHREKRQIPSETGSYPAASAAPLLINKLTIDPNSSPRNGDSTNQFCGPHRVFSVSYSPDGDRMVVGIGSGLSDSGCNFTGSIQLFDMTKEEPSHTLTLNDSHWIRSAAWRFDSSMLAVGGYGLEVRIHNATAPGLPLISHMPANNQWIHSVDWSHDGSLLAVEDDTDHIISIYNVTTPEYPSLSRALNESSAGISSIAWSHNGFLLAAGGHDKKVIIYHPTASAFPVSTMNEASARVRCLGWSPDDAWLAVGGEDKKFRIYNVTTPGSPALSHTEDLVSEVRSVAWSHNGCWLAVGMRNGQVMIFNVTAPYSPSLWYTLGEESDSMVYSLSWNNDDSVLATGEHNGIVSIYSINPVITDHKAEVIAGSDACLPCQYSGRAFNVTWKKGCTFKNANVLASYPENGENAEPEADDGHFRLLANKTLIIKNVSQEDAGQYFCGVNVGGGYRHSPTQLFVDNKTATEATDCPTTAGTTEGLTSAGTTDSLTTAGATDGATIAGSTDNSGLTATTIAPLSITAALTALSVAALCIYRKSKAYRQDDHSTPACTMVKALLPSGCCAEPSSHADALLENMETEVSTAV